MAALLLASQFKPVAGIVWIIAATIILSGAAGVVLFRNPVHNALSLVATLFGVAVMFVIQEAYFLAAIQVIVYAGAIVILFLFVIMLLGVDKLETLGVESNAWRRPLAGVAAIALIILIGIGALATTRDLTGARSVKGSLRGTVDINQIGELLFTKYVWAFEITSVLLTVAVLGAVLLSRKSPGPAIDLDEFPLPEPEPDFDEYEPDEDPGVATIADETEVVG